MAILFYATPVFFAACCSSSSSRCGSAGCPSRGARAPTELLMSACGTTGIYLLDAIASATPPSSTCCARDPARARARLLTAGIFLRLCART
jgi:hypothetical protein